MTARFVRERRCVICDHRVHEVPDPRPPAQWDSRCDEGCECTTAYCQPYRVYTDGTTNRQHKQENLMSQQPYQAPSADDFLMGGGGAPTAKFPTGAYGTVVSGRITERPTVEQQRDIKTGNKKFWDDGNPMMQLVVTVQTEQRDPAIEDDDGRRRLFIKGQLKNAIADAVRSAGAKGLEVGGTLAVKYTHDGTASGPGMSPPKQYVAHYTAAAANTLLAPDPVAPAPQYAAPAAAAPAPQQYAAPPAPAAPVQQANPAVAALVAQQQAQAAAAPPPF